MNYLLGIVVPRYSEPIFQATRCPLDYATLALVAVAAFLLGSAVTLWIVAALGNPRADQLQEQLDKEKKYIDELYFTLRREICAVLDADRKRMNDLGKPSDPPGKT